MSQIGYRPSTAAYKATPDAAPMPEGGYQPTAPGHMRLANEFDAISSQDWWARIVAIMESDWDSTGSTSSGTPSDMPAMEKPEPLMRSRSEIASGTPSPDAMDAKYWLQIRNRERAVSV